MVQMFFCDFSPKSHKQPTTISMQFFCDSLEGNFDVIPQAPAELADVGECRCYQDVSSHSTAPLSDVVEISPISTGYGNYEAFWFHSTSSTLNSCSYRLEMYLIVKHVSFNMAKKHF